MLSSIVGLSYASFRKRRQLASKEQIGNIKIDKAIEKKLCKVYTDYLGYLEKLIKLKIGNKKGLIRSHILGHRCHFSFRAVISPLTEVRPGDEIILPWKIAVQTFNLEILNYLQRKWELDLQEAIEKQKRALINYDEEINEIFRIIMHDITHTPIKYIDEIGVERTIFLKGIPVLLGRNPTLRRGSIYFLYVTKIKTDVEDKTIDISDMVSSPPNLDFDGDEMFGLNIKTLNLVPTLLNTHPRECILDLNYPGVSNMIMLDKPTLINLNSFLRYEVTDEPPVVIIPK
jgi:hypothetical protein